MIRGEGVRGLGSKAMIDRVVESVSGGEVWALLPQALQAEIALLSREEVREAAIRTLARPQPGSVSQSGRLLMNPCLAVQWLSVFEELELPRPMRVYEPCSGASEPVILATQMYTGGLGEYVTLNLNRPLAAQLRPKLTNVRLPVTIIEDYAQNAPSRLTSASFDVACFHHAINDLLQTAVSEPRGMDTRTVDWWPNERTMIQWLAEEWRAGTLHLRARPALMDAVRFASDLVKPGGFLLFDHWTWIGHREQEWFPWELFCDMVPLTRRWIQEERLPLVERPLPGLDPQWWMCLQR